MQWSRVSLILIAPLLFTSCGSETDWELLKDVEADRFDRLRRRANLTVIDTAGNPFTKSWTDFNNDVSAHCEGTVLAGTGTQRACEGVSPGCTQAHCDAFVEHCIASIYQEVAGLTDQPLDLGSYTVPRQPAPVNAELHERAIDEALDAIDLVQREIRNATGLGTSGSCTATNLEAVYNNPETYGRSFAFLLIEAYNLAREAADDAVAANLALADQYFSEEPTDRDAAELAMSAPLQSRAHAAHILVAGDEGLWDESAGAVSLETALCTNPPLSPQGRAALSVFRESALDPTRIIGTADTDDIVLNDVRPALTELWDYNGWASDDIGTFTDRFGLARQDFVEAREHMRQEHHAFARSGTKQLAARALAGGGSTTQLRYASTARPPSLPHWTWYSTLARRRSEPPDNEAPYPDIAYARRGLAPFIDYVLTEITHYLNNDTAFSATLQTEILDPLAV